MKDFLSVNVLKHEELMGLNQGMTLPPKKTFCSYQETFLVATTWRHVTTDIYLVGSPG